MKTAAILLRVSTYKQEMESQYNDLLPTIKNQGYTVPKKYIFGQKITGRDNVRNEERESLVALKKACETGEVKAVFISEVSRLSRDSIAGRLYLRDFEELKIPIYFKDISMWTLDPVTLEKNHNTSSFLGTLLDYAERELEQIVKRSMRGRKQSAREGKVTGSYLRFGYKKDLETKKYIIDKEEADFIVDLYNRYITGEYSIRSLTNYANTTGVKTRVRKNSRKGTYKTRGGVVKSTDSVIWTTQTIRSILVEKMYLGERSFKDITYEIPAIVTEEMYDKVQERLKLNVRTISKAKHTHLLQRKLICGSCGSFYYGHYKARSNNYICSGYVRTANICNNTSLNYERAEGIIWNFVVNETYFFKKITGEERDRLLTEQSNKQTELLERRDKLLSLKAKEDNKVKNLVNAVAEGLLLPEDIGDQRKEIEALVNSYNSDLVKIDSELGTIDKRIEYISNQSLTASALKHIESDRELMREKINEIIDKIVVYKLDGFVALLQVHYLNKVYNLFYRYRTQKNRYYLVEDGIATFNNPHYQPEEIKSVIKGKVSEFQVTDTNNAIFTEDIFGNYSGRELIDIMDKQGIYRDYERTSIKWIIS